MNSKMSEQMLGRRTWSSTIQSVRILFLAVWVVATAACGLFERETSVILLFTPSAAAPRSIEEAGGRGILPGTAEIRISVKGSGLKKEIVKEFPFAGTEINARFGLLPRYAYEFLVEALDPSGIVLSRGSASLVVVPGPNSLSIPLRLMPRVFVTNQGSDTVTVINGWEGSLRRTITVAANPVAICANSSTRKIYVAHFDQDISVIEWDGGSTMKTISYTGNDYPSIAVNASLNRVFAAWQYDNEMVQFIDGSTDEISTEAAFHTYPTSFASNDATGKLYILYWGNSLVQVLNASTHAEITTVEPIPADEKCGIAVNRRTNRVYVTSGDDPGSVYVIDGATDSLISSIPVGASTSGDGSDIAVNSSTNMVYVSNSADGTVSVIDGSTGVVTGTVSVGENPLGVAVSEVLNRVYVAVRGDGSTNGSVAVINGATNGVIATFAVGIDPQDIVVYE